MQLVKYGITLKSISLKDLEQMRKWRNMEHVRLNMEFQKLITKEEQRLWYLQLDDKFNLYFVILKDKEKIGIVNLKAIDLTLQRAEAGIFIGKLDHLNSTSSILATIGIMEFAFDVLKLKTLRAKIASTNCKAILFNESIGYRKSIKCNSSSFDYYEVESQKFREATKKIRITLNKLNNNKYSLKMNSKEKANFGLL